MGEVGRMNRAFLVIDVRAKTYTRYVGRTRHCGFSVDRVLGAEEIEQLRRAPSECAENVPPEPVVA